jgi:hypothetical protein
MLTRSAYTSPDLNLGQYRTAPGGGIEVPARTVINATTTLWFYIPGQSCTDNLQFTITVNIVPYLYLLIQLHNVMFIIYRLLLIVAIILQGH